MLSYDSDSKIVLIEEEPVKEPKRYNTTQVKPYVENPEEVAVNLMSFLSKIIDYYSDVDDGGALYPFATDISELHTGRSMNSEEHSRS